jgi:hypothetical protein
MTTKNTPSSTPKHDPAKDAPQPVDSPMDESARDSRPEDRIARDGGSVVVNTELAAESANEGTNVTFTNPETGAVETLPHTEYMKLRDEKGW